MKDIWENVLKSRKMHFSSDIGVTLTSSRRYIVCEGANWHKIGNFYSAGIIPYNKPDQAFTSELYIFQKKLGRYQTLPNLLLYWEPAKNTYAGHNILPIAHLGTLCQVRK